MSEFEALLNELKKRPSWEKPKSGIGRDEVLRLAREAGLVGFGNDSPYADKLNRFAALVTAAELQRAKQIVVDGAVSAAVAEERKARIAAQEELAACREAMTRAEHEAQRARGELAVAVAAEGRCISHSDPRSFWHPGNKRAGGQS